MPTPSASGAEPRPKTVPVPRDPGPAGPRGSEYAELSRLVKQAGLLDRRLGYYTWKITLMALALAAGWAVFVLAGDSWWQLATAVFLAVVFTQLGFLGHDAGHRQMFRSARSNYLLGRSRRQSRRSGSATAGGWTSTTGTTPTPTTRARTPTSASARWSSPRSQARASRGLRPADLPLPGLAVLPDAAARGARPARRQHPGADQQVTAGARRNRQPDRVRGGAARGCTSPATSPSCSLVLSPVKAVAVHRRAAGAVRPLPGLLVRPQPQGHARCCDADDQPDFLQRQVLTSRNVRGGPLTDFALGGLNYQIEHHLFPSMPSPNLPRSQPLIAAYCASHGLPYTEATLLGSYTQALRYLNTIGRRTRPVPPPSPAAIQP